MQKGTLYIVATPIGNLKDITFRAIEILNSVDVVACEDTRVTQKLLNHYKIATKTISYHKFSEKERSVSLINLLNEGKNIALVSDAGTPLISDPGSILVCEARKSNIKVVPVCGASAVITVLSSIYTNGDFAFCGFFPQKPKDAENILTFYKNFNLVFYESPNRILKTLYLIREIIGSVEVSVARELTKIYEDINTFEISEMINYLESTIVKGEIVFVIHKSIIEKEKINLNQHIKKLQDKGFGAKDISIILSTLFNVSKNDLYKNICK